MLFFNLGPVARRQLRVAAAALIVLALAPGKAVADEPSSQFANIAPLPGAGFALNREGKPDGSGALQVNVPVAYTPGADYVSLGFYGGSHVGEHASNFPNGSVGLGLGFGDSPRLYFSAMQVSSLIFKDSKAMSAQLQLVEETDRVPAIAFGVQDALNKESSSGEGRGYYGVLTKSFALADRSLFLTLGYGTGRFLNRPFGGVSLPLGGQFNFAVEYDGFQMNEAVAWRPGGRYGSVTLLAGFNNRCGVLVGAGGQGRVPTWAQLAVGAALFAIKE